MHLLMDPFSVLLTGDTDRKFVLRFSNYETYLAEGFATTATLHELTGVTANDAFEVGNLEPVAVSLRQDSPQSRARR